MINGSFNLHQTPASYGIEYGGFTIRLGGTWPDICQSINEQIPDKKIAASLKLVLYEKLKESLGLRPDDREPLMQEYADTL
jgi:hypothetical protein